MPACACILMHIHTCIYIIYIRMQVINEHVAENSKWLTCMYMHNNNIVHTCRHNSINRD